EAHPCENVPSHDCFERKLACAALFREEAGIGRDILVDDLDGAAHRAYGLMPNMTWVIGRGGRVAYKANWTSAMNVEAFLERLLAARGGHPAGTTRGMYETQRSRKEKTWWGLGWGLVVRGGDLVPCARPACGGVGGAVGSCERAAAAVAAGGGGPVAGAWGGPGRRPGGGGERDHRPHRCLRAGGGPGSVPGWPGQAGGRGPQEHRGAGCGAGPGAAGAG